MSNESEAILRALRLIPEFEGNPNVLTRFIKICDEIVGEYVVDGKPHMQLLSVLITNGILNKITGNAARIINSNGIPEDWSGIKKALINNFSDQRDETALYNDLMVATQGNMSPQEFYDKCVNLFSTIMTYVSLHDTISTTVDAKRTLYRKLTLQAYVRGLKEPLGSRIRCMRPESIEKALEYVHDELNVMYLQQRNNSLPERRPHVSHTMPTAMPPAPHKLFNSSAAHTSHWPGPNQFYFQGKSPNYTNQQPFNQFNRGNNQAYNIPSRTQQMFRAPPPNYNPQQNKFSLPPQNRFNNQHGPKPMSGVSHYVAKPMPSFQGRDWRTHGNPPPNNYFKARDINLNECLAYDDAYYPYYTPDYYDYPSYPEYVQDCNDIPYEEYDPQYDPRVEEIPNALNEPRPGSSSTQDESNFRTDPKSPKPK